MSVIADFHLHIYPKYDLAALLTALGGNLSQLRAELKPPYNQATLAAFLTERHDCDLFTALRQGELSLPASVTVSPSAEPQCLVVNSGSLEILLFAGRQINTRERIELLSVTGIDLIPDGMALNDTIEMIRAQGAIPAINWAPGKWLFGRGRQVHGVISNQPPPLLLCDTTLRPQSWATPKLMQFGIDKGLKVIAGTDPLPIDGQEQIAGSYGSLVELDLDLEKPVSSIRKALSSKDSVIRSIGKRNTVKEMLHRLWSLKGCRPS